MYCTRCGHPNKDEARYCANCGAVLQEETTLGLNPVEIEAEGPEEFPFPEDELKSGQALLLVKHGPNAGSTFMIEADVTSTGRNPESDIFLDDITRQPQARRDPSPTPTGSTSTTSEAERHLREPGARRGHQARGARRGPDRAGSDSCSSWGSEDVATRNYLSIGEVLVSVKTEFPDITISKIRFLESEGLIEPERTPSGYRKFYDKDVDRLRSILRMQRDEYLPAEGDQGPAVRDRRAGRSGGGRRSDRTRRRRAGRGARRGADGSADVDRGDERRHGRSIASGSASSSRSGS